jgi:hypothetical protein
MHAAGLTAGSGSKGSTKQAGVAGSVGRKLCSTIQAMARAVFGRLKPPASSTPSQHDYAPLLEVVVVCH